MWCKKYIILNLFIQLDQTNFELKTFFLSKNLSGPEYQISNNNSKLKKCYKSLSSINLIVNILSSCILLSNRLKPDGEISTHAPSLTFSWSFHEAIINVGFTRFIIFVFPKPSVAGCLMVAYVAFPHVSIERSY